MAIWYGQWPVPSSPTGSDSAASTDAPGASEGWISPRALCSPKTRTAATDWAVSSPTLLTLTCAESVPSRGSTTGAIEMLMLPAAAGPTRQSASAGAPTRTSCRWCLMAARRLAQLQAAENRRRASVADQAGPAARAPARPGVEAAPTAGAGLAGGRVAEQDGHREREVREDERVGAVPPAHAYVDPRHAAPRVVGDHELADPAHAARPIAVEPAAAAPDPGRARREGEREHVVARRVLDQEARAGRRRVERAEGARDGELGPQREPIAPGGAVLGREQAAEPERLPGAQDLADLEAAAGGAAVPGHEVAVVALLAGVEDAVAARLEPAARRAAVAGDEVAVVALLARVDDAVAAVADGRETARRRNRAADLGAHHVAEHEVDVGEAAAAQVAVAHDGPARADDRSGVAVGLLVVALVDGRAVAVRVRCAEVVADLVRHHQHVPDLRRVGEVEVAEDLRHPKGVTRVAHRADVGDPALHGLAGDEVDQGVRPGDRVHVVGRVGPVVPHLGELLVGRGGAPGIGRRRPEANVREAQAHGHVALVDRRGGGGERRQVIEG